MTIAELIKQGQINNEAEYEIALELLVIELDKSSNSNEEDEEANLHITKLSNMLEAYEVIHYDFGGIGKPTTEEELKAFLIEQGIEYEEVPAS